MIDLKVFKKILQLIRETDVTEVEICEGEQKIRICRGAVIPNSKERVLRENIAPLTQDFTHESILAESAQKIIKKTVKKWWK